MVEAVKVRTAAIEINGPDGERMVAVYTTPPRVEYGPNYAPDEAARIFWEALAGGGVSVPCAVCAARERDDG